MANVGGIDRIMRFVVGALLLIAPFLPPFAGFFAGWGPWKFAVAVWGLGMIGTALFRFCPAYTLFGIRTCEMSKK